jgi:hypothetical protein
VDSRLGVGKGDRSRENQETNPDGEARRWKMVDSRRGKCDVHFVTSPSALPSFLKYTINPTPPL